MKAESLAAPRNPQFHQEWEAAFGPSTSASNPAIPKPPAGVKEPAHKQAAAGKT